MDERMSRRARMRGTTVYLEVVERIMRDLYDGVPPWTKPWRRGGRVGLPREALSGRRYGGFDALLLWQSASDRGYPSDRWVDAERAAARGLRARTGERPVHVLSGNRALRARAARPTVRAARGSTAGFTGDGLPPRGLVPELTPRPVFNVAQLDRPLLGDDSSGADATDGEDTRAPWARDPWYRPKHLLAHVGADVRFGGNRAEYHPRLDRILMPIPSQFEAPEHFYATALHEHVHWTGHPSRLDRGLLEGRSHRHYAYEELVAELGAAFLCALLGVRGRLRHASYLEAWLAAIRERLDLLFVAAETAQAAADYLERLAPGCTCDPAPATGAGHPVPRRRGRPTPPDRGGDWDGLHSSAE